MTEKLAVNRRDFLKGVAVAGATLTMAPPIAGAADEGAVMRSPRQLRILILGGTGFLGPHQVRYAIARGHRVTLFNRGKTNPALFPEVEKLRGDRMTNDYATLKGHEWDVVVDNSATLPRWVREAAAALKGRAKQYVFISSMSVYAKSDTPGADEAAEVLKTDEPNSEDPRRLFSDLYGPLKELSEQEAQRGFPDRATILRPGLIVGPGDATDRFTYWPARLQRGGEVLAPGSPLDLVQFIDVRDLAQFAVRVCEDGTAGVYNCIGPRAPLAIGEMLGTIRRVTKSDAYLTWVDAEFLAAQGVHPWTNMPVWVPGTGKTAGFCRRSNARALAKGLSFLPLATTAKDTLDFYNAEPEERRKNLRAGISPEREKAVLAAWHARSNA